MKTDTPNMNSGKTRFSRGKQKGESWTDRRDAWEKEQAAQHKRNSYGISQKETEKVPCVEQ